MRIEKINGSYIIKEYKSLNVYVVVKKWSFLVGYYLFIERKRKSKSNNFY